MGREDCCDDGGQEGEGKDCGGDGEEKKGKDRGGDGGGGSGGRA